MSRQTPLRRDGSLPLGTRTEIGDMMRSILREAHETMDATQDGPFYVRFIRGQFFLVSWGERAKYRYWYEVRWEIDKIWQGWVFVVMYGHHWLEFERYVRDYTLEMERQHG